MWGTPAASTQKALFQSLSTPLRIPRCRSLATPSGASVSRMSKKSPFTPTTAVGVHHVGDGVPGGDVAPRDQVESDAGRGRVDPDQLPAGHAAGAGERELLEAHAGCDG